MAYELLEQRTNPRANMQGLDNIKKRGSKVLEKRISMDPLALDHGRYGRSN